jgi:hypothetical protein
MASTDDPGRRDLPLIGLMLCSFATLIKGEGRTPPLSCCHAFWGPGVTTYRRTAMSRSMPRPLRTINRHQRPIERARKTSSEEAERIKISTTLLFEQKESATVCRQPQQSYFITPDPAQTLRRSSPLAGYTNPRKRLMAPPVAMYLRRITPARDPKGLRMFSNTTTKTVNPACPAKSPTAVERYAAAKTTTGRTIQ